MAANIGHRYDSCAQSTGSEGMTGSVGVMMAVALGLTVLVVLTLVAGCALLPAGGGTSATVTSDLPYATTTSIAPTTTSSLPPATVTTAPPATTTTNPVAIPKEGKEYAVLPTDDKVVALTFDAAYDPEPLNGILAALKAGNAKGTFFLTGEFVRDFPDSVRAIRAAGHAIGNHSWSHPDFVNENQEEIRSQLRRTAAALEELGVADPRPLFRFPYGSRNARTLEVVAAEGYLSYFWTIDTLDWKEDRTPEQVRASVLDRLRPGAIVLMHVGSRQTESVLPQLLEDLADRGYKTIGLREALEAYGT